MTTVTPYGKRRWGLHQDDLQCDIRVLRIYHLLYQTVVSNPDKAIWWPKTALQIEWAPLPRHKRWSRVTLRHYLWYIYTWAHDLETCARVTLRLLADNLRGYSETDSDTNKNIPDTPKHRSSVGLKGMGINIWLWILFRCRPFEVLFKVPSD